METALIAVIGSVIVALIAAVTANARQTSQLDHDRELQDLAELRSILDEGLSAFRDVRRLFGNRMIELPRIYREEQEEVRKMTYSMGLARNRIIIRLGPEHPVTKAYGEAVDLCRPYSRFIRRLPSEIPAEDQSALQHELDELRRPLPRAAEAFVVSANALVGSRLRDDARAPSLRFGRVELVIAKRKDARAPHTAEEFPDPEEAEEEASGSGNETGSRGSP
jgi:hypothetical protein